MPKDQTHVIFCKCAFNHVIRRDSSRAVLDALCDSVVAFTALDDLCRAVARGELDNDQFADGARVVVAACHPRAVRALLAAAGVETGDLDLHVLDMRSKGPAELAAALGDLFGEPTAHSIEPPDMSRRGDWVPWFPVIDRQRCVNCRQCLSFCLFGVYEADGNGRVMVANPANCKTNCPACARICPEVAIIFPKHPTAPINGADIRDEELEKARVRADVDEILGGDLRQALAKPRRMRRVRLLDSEKVAEAFTKAPEPSRSDREEP